MPLAQRAEDICQANGSAPHHADAIGPGGCMHEPSQTAHSPLPKRLAALGCRSGVVPVFLLSLVSGSLIRSPSTKNHMLEKCIVT